MQRLLLSVGLVAIAACDAYDGDLGSAPFLCGPTEPRCPMGYSCMADSASGSEICVGNGSSSPTDFACADDSATEPNDTVAKATPTSLDAMKTFALDGLAICPTGDKDNFAIQIGTAGETVALVVEFQATGAVLEAALLNQGGVAIAHATPTDVPTTIRLEQHGLSIGMFYAQVKGPTTGVLTKNNYKITIDVTP